MVIKQIDERVSALHREATANKKINWDKAVNCLKEATDLMKKSNVIYPTEQWTRLPIFLQQAGRFDEAMKEFQKLLDDAKPRITKETVNWVCPVSASKMYTYLAYSIIYDKMRIACKRQGLLEKAKEYEKLSKKHQSTFSRLRTIDDKARNAESEAVRQRR